MSEEEKQVGLDLQILDMHWHICRRMLSDPALNYSVEEFALCTGGKIDWDAVTRYAECGHKFGTKVADLGLNELEQTQCIKLQGEACRKRKEAVIRRVRAVRVELDEWFSRPSSRAPRTRADELIKSWQLLRLGKDSPTDASRLFTLQTGTHINDSKLPLIRSRLTKDKALLTKILKEPGFGKQAGSYKKAA